ncbi:protein trichome birefringence-like 34 [Rhodamnia argentea]|uniref:Protein trichome birefringence-like 34 n=1 Tax=Rhodamnia argentea TaxID=178133 RepID=A0A8B8PSL8_9MYRT|nr:protein trichome birefringence-like 34 [Rhodamnia argentea]
MAGKAQTAGGTGRETSGSFHVLVALLIAAGVIAVVYLTCNEERQILEEADTSREALWSTGAKTERQKCDLFSGRWVYDNVSYPLYEEKRCTYMSDEQACEKYGRKDLKYQHWRWQPHGCDIPRFNATRLLERLRNKRMVYVGDSLNRGQWYSMVCLVESSIPRHLKSVSHFLNHSLFVFKSYEYNATIEFYWEPMLVESNKDNAYNHSAGNRTVRVHAIENHARHWSDADILIFDSYIWWANLMMKVLWGSFGSADGIYKTVKASRAFEMALNTWSDWLEMHISRSKTRLFFVSSSPTHERAAEWGGADGENCYGETEPITREDYSGRSLAPELMRLVKNAIDKLKTRGVTVQFLNITLLSEYRKDAHPTIYKRQWRALTKDQIANPKSYADCGHWCLPGVPDVWNELLYAYLLRN